MAVVKFGMSVFALMLAAAAGQNVSTTVPSGIAAKIQGNYTLGGFADLPSAQQLVDTPGVVPALNAGFCGRYGFDASFCQTKLVASQTSRRLFGVAAIMRKLQVNYNVSVVASYSVNVPFGSSQTAASVQADLSNLPPTAMTTLVNNSLVNAGLTPPLMFVTAVSAPVATLADGSGTLAPVVTTTTAPPSTTPWTPQTTIVGSFSLTIVGLSASSSAANLATSAPGKLGIMKAIMNQIDPTGVLANKYYLNVTLATSRRMKEEESRELLLGLSATVVVSYGIGLPPWAPFYVSPRVITPLLSPGYSTQGALLVGINYQLGQAMGNTAPTVTQVTGLTVPQVYVNGVLVTTASPTTATQTSTTETTVTTTTTLFKAGGSGNGLVSSSPRTSAWAAVHAIAAVLAVSALC